MTEIQADQEQITNGKDQAENRPQPLWKKYGMNQYDCSEAVGQSHDNMRKLGNAALKIEKASDLLKLLRQADETCDEDYDLSVRAIEGRRAEIFELLETQPVPWVNAFAHLARHGLVQMTPKTGGADGAAE